MSWYCCHCGALQDATGRCSRDGAELLPRAGLLGSTAGNYTLVELIGRGAMGEVYRAINPAIEAVVAIKVLHATASRGPSSAGQFLHEARAVNRVRHDGVVKIVDGGYLPTGLPFLVMELLAGESLAQRIARQRIDLGSALAIMTDVLEVLAAAHDAGIVHRDLKPANVFLTRAGRTLVLDFGVAKLTDGTGSVTRTGAMVGTPAYMSPEQVMSDAVDGRADLYAVGVMLFELASGHRPFDGPNAFAIAQAHVSQPIPRLPPGLPGELQAVIDRALTKDRLARVSSAAAMRDELAAVPIAPTSDAAATIAGTPRAVGSGRRRATRLWFAAAALVLVGTIVAVIAMDRAPDRAAQPVDAAVTSKASVPVAQPTDANLDARESTWDGPWVATGAFREGSDVVTFIQEGPRYLVQRRANATLDALLFSGIARVEGDSALVAFGPPGFDIQLSVFEENAGRITGRWIAGSGVVGSESWTERAGSDDPFVGTFFVAGESVTGVSAGRAYMMSVVVTRAPDGHYELEWTQRDAKRQVLAYVGIGVRIERRLIVASTQSRPLEQGGKSGVVLYGLGLYDLRTGAGSLVTRESDGVKQTTESLRRP